MTQVDDLSLFHEITGRFRLRVGASHVTCEVVIEGKGGGALGTTEGLLVGVKLALVPCQPLRMTKKPGMAQHFPFRSLHPLRFTVVDPE